MKQFIPTCTHEPETVCLDVEMPDPKSEDITTFQSFHYSAYRWLWFGAMGFYMAMNMQMITRGWLVLGLAEDSPFALSLVMVAFTLPMTVVSPMGGALADRFSRKRLAVTTLCGTSSLTFLLATLDFTGIIRFWHLIVIGAANGVLMAINMPSRQALVSNVVPEPVLMNAVSLINSGMNLAKIMGPALAGVLIIYLNTHGVFYIIAGFHLFSAFSMVLVQTKRKKSTTKPKGLFAEIGAGMVYVGRDRTLLGLMIMGTIPTILAFPAIILLPAWARETLDVQSDNLGFLLMIMGIGALVGTLVLASLSDFKKRGLLMMGVGLVLGFCVVMFAQVNTYFTAVPLLLMTGLASGIFFALNMSLLQIYAEDAMRGRVMSLAMMTFGAVPIGIIPIGFLAEKIGTANALGVSGWVLAFFTVVYAFCDRNILKIQ